MSGYRDLLVWQSALKIAEDAYRHTEHLPRSEMYGLTSQLRRTAISIPSNIAEGHGRNSPKEFNHFLGIALGSLCELEAHILLGIRLKFFAEADLIHLLQISSETAKMLHGLKKSLIYN